MTNAGTSPSGSRARSAWRATLTGAAAFVFCAAVVLWVRLVPLDLHDSHSNDDDRPAADWTYTGEDGREHVYLGDFDSYLWLRHARHLLETGQACDEVADGECRDMHTNAPVGARSPYARSLHVAAIAGLQRLVTTWLAPRQSLPVTAYWTTVVVALLGVLPAFGIGRLLAGTVAGVFAVVATALDPRVLARTIGSDNDVWSVVLPLYVLWLVLGALRTRGTAASVGCVVAAGFCTGLHAWAWRGWTFVHVIVVTALVCVLLAEALRSAIEHGVTRARDAAGVRRTAIVLLALVVASGVATSVTPDGGYVRIVHDLLAGFVPQRAPAAGAELAWPSNLGTVAELASLDLAAIARQAGGTGILVGAWLGIVLLLLPRAGWRARHRTVLLLAMLAGGALVVTGLQSLLLTIALLAGPLVAAAIAGRDGDQDDDRVARAAAITLVVWFVAAAYGASGGSRLYLFVVPPLGIGCAVLVGRTTSALRSEVASSPRWYRALATTALWIVLPIAFLRVLDPGYAMARRYRPLINDAWWDALTRLRETTPHDAIVHTWWDYGHWASYVADRRVANDGSSLLTHIPYWTSRALLAPSDAESAGVLRMLSCGSDALPLPEGESGAYATVLRTGRDPLTAFATVAALVERDAPAADAYLAAQGFTPSERLEVLRATHCAPPEAYLVLTTRLLGKRSALVAASAWDPRRPDGSARRGDGHEDAAAAGVPFVVRWIACDEPTPEGEVVCPIGFSIGGGRTVLESVAYDDGAPGDARLTSRPGAGGPAISGAPALVLIAGAGGLERVVPAAPVHPDLGILIDEEQRRVLVGAPLLLESTLVELLFLDGRYARHFVKVDERTSGDETVTVWKVVWPSAAAATRSSS